MYFCLKTSVKTFLNDFREIDLIEKHLLRVLVKKTCFDGENYDRIKIFHSNFKITDA